jgi:signal transduction histidine kinase
MHATTPRSEPARPRPFSKDGPYSRSDVFWLLRLRWYAIAGVAATIGFSAWFDLVETIPQLLAVTGIMAAANLALWLVCRARLHELGQRMLETAIVPQLVLDLTALALLVHFAGGVENPFVMFFAFHMAIGAMFLRPHLAWAVGLAGGLFQALLTVGEGLGMLPHHHLAFAFGHGTHPDLHRMPAYVGGYLLAFGLMVAGVVYFVQTVAERTRRAEALRQEHERIALSRERLARLGELSAGVAHAIRNPLHGLFNCVAILRQRAEGTQAAVDEMLELLDEGLKRIDRVIWRLLALAREAPLRRLPTDFNVLAADAVRFVEVRARERRVGVSVELGPLPALLLDADRIGEVLINLLDNAFDASPNGGTITLRTQVSTLSTPSVVIEVCDTGTGIAAEHLGSIFDPFFTTKAVGEGSGLGLAIARQVIEEHGGQIQVESQAGRGSTFRILLPLNGAGALDAGGLSHER